MKRAWTFPSQKKGPWEILETQHGLSIWAQPATEKHLPRKKFEENDSLPKDLLLIRAAVTVCTGDEKRSYKGVYVESALIAELTSKHVRDGPRRVKVDYFRVLLCAADGRAFKTLEVATTCTGQYTLGEPDEPKRSVSVKSLLLPKSSSPRDGSGKASDESGHARWSLLRRATGPNGDAASRLRKRSTA